MKLLLGLSTALGFLLLAAGCSHLPISSLPRLASFDPATADLATLRAAVRAPDALRPVPGGAVLTMSFWLAGAETQKTTVAAVLEEEGDAAVRAALKPEEKPGFRITVFRLSEDGRRRLEAAREEMRTLKAREAAKGSRVRGSLSVGVKGCAAGTLPDGPILLSTYLRTEASGSFIPLVVDLDLKALAAEAGADPAPIEPCAR
ncbi:hypothetical protein ACI7BZ_03700 [Xanthobacter sp. AM11]|uniref:hypothetical protein n=1 Tax=Xanthobacter sp. AM11 TaxID=3380643 RepID=UPI0039BF773F